MIKAIHSALSARRSALTQDEEKGFTLIELLVVVIIIGILAAIAIPVYLGVQNNAKDASVQSDVANFKTAVVSMETGSGNLPTGADMVTNAAFGDAGFAFITNSSDISSAATKAGVTWGSDTTTLEYLVGTDASGTPAFCVEAVSTTGSVFDADNSTGVTKIANGNSLCDIVEYNE